MQTDLTNITRTGRTSLARRTSVVAVALLAVAASASQLAAQTPTAPTPFPPPFPDPSTCPIKYGIKSFILEDIITGASFQSIFTPTLNAAQIAAFSDPTKEIHTQFQFSTSDMTMRAYSIPLPLNSPPITPANTDFAGLNVAGVVNPIDKIYTTCTPRPTILITGTIQSGSAVFGSVVGLPHTLGFSYDPTKTVNNGANLTVTDVGANTVVGLQFTAVVVPAPAPAPLVVLNPGAKQASYSKQLFLDASKSTDPGGSALSYAWTQVGTSPVAGIANANTATPLVTFGSGAGDYVFQVVVTNTAGQSTTAQTTISYLGR
jgi:hypothetical protein